MWSLSIRTQIHETNLRFNYKRKFKNKLTPYSQNERNFKRKFVLTIEQLKYLFLLSSNSQKYLRLNLSLILTPLFSSRKFIIFGWLTNQDDFS